MAAMLGYHDTGEGLPLVFLHAFPLHAAMWEPQLRGLGSRARCLAVDAPGRGRSAAVPPCRSLDDRTDQLIALLDHVKLDKIVLVGLSMGGYTALTFCRRFPGRLAALVLADTRAQADTEEGRQGRMAMSRTAEAQGQTAIAELMLPKLLGATTQHGRRDLVAHVRELIHAVPVPAIVSDLHAMAARPDATPLLPGIPVPTLIVVGEEDVPTPPADARAMAERIPGAQLAILRHAGHLSNLEQPDAFNQAIKDFLDELRKMY